MGFVKRAIFLCGILSLSLLLVALAGTTYALHRNHTLDRESHAFADAAVTAVVAHWSADELLRRASPQFLRASTPNAVRAFVASAASRFGALVNYEGAQGQAQTQGAVGFDLNSTITAIYLSHALFEKGEVEFQIELVRVNGEWKISGFHLNEPPPADRPNQRQV